MTTKQQVSAYLSAIEQWHFVICLVSVLVALLSRDTKWFLFSLLTAVSFAIAMSLEDVIKGLDNSVKIYRYVFWVLNDFIWCAAIFWLWLRKYIYGHQMVVAAYCTTILIGLNIMRSVARHYFDLAASNWWYQSAYPAVTALIVLACWLPLLDKLRKRWNGSRH